MHCCYYITCKVFGLLANIFNLTFLISFCLTYKFDLCRLPFSYFILEKNLLLLLLLFYLFCFLFYLYMIFFFNSFNHIFCATYCDLIIKINELNKTEYEWHFILSTTFGIIKSML